MDPLTLGALGIGVASTIGGFINQQSVNSQNLKIAREQMNFNAAEAQKQRDFISQQNDVAMNYNSASNQVNRLREAGLNPALGDVTAGQASSTVSGSAASAGSVPQMQAFDIAGAGTGIASTLLQAAAVDKTRADTRLVENQGIGQDINNQYLHQQNQLQIMEALQRIDSMKIDSSYKDMLRKDLLRQYEENSATFEARKSQIEKQNALLDAQREQVLSDSALKSSQKIIQELATKSQIRLNNAQAANLYQGIKESSERIIELQEQHKLTKKQVSLVANQAAKTIAEKVGIDNNNKAYPTFIKKTEAEIRSLDHIHGTYGLKLGALGTIGIEGEFRNNK